jgi:hypothetical protein
MEEQMQRQRFERKYFITERQAMLIREFARSRLVPDKFSEGKPNCSYPVHSLYLDSDSLLTYWATVHCEKKRFKIRVRYYDDNPESPLFFEIKRRENECVLKQRGLVRRSAGAAILAGHLPGPEHMVTDKSHHLAAVQRFSFLLHKMNARPMVHVAYMREAWVSPDSNSVRLTVDRFVRGEVRHRPVFDTQMANPIYPFGEQRVLELKFTDRFPDWFNELVRHFDLVQSGVPKYCGSVTEAGDNRISGPAPNSLQQKLAQLREYC